jgi:hypothetical protein
MAKSKEVTTDDLQLDDVSVDLGRAREGGLSELEVPVGDLSSLMADEKFMHEKLTVYLADPADENDFPFAVVGVNGVPKSYRRGDSHEMRRCEVEVLARSKIMRVKTVRRLAPDGSETMEPQVTYTPVYPFSVTRDPSGAKGVEWLKRIMAQPA